MTEIIEHAKEPNNSSTFDICPQPTETTCGPTCLHAVYRYLGYEYDLHQLIDEIRESPNGGTFSVMLAEHALRCGFKATIYTYNVNIFDPTWDRLEQDEIADKLRQRLTRADSAKDKAKLTSYIRFFELGGRLRFDELTPTRLRKILRKGSPIIAGLSSTYLYRECRLSRSGKPDDIHGEPEGHFVVVADWHSKKKRFVIADPYLKNPMSSHLVYQVKPNRLINSILLGIVTYDANLLVIKAPDTKSK